MNKTILFIVIFYCLSSCTKPEEILIPSEPIIITRDSSSVITQIFNTSYADDLFSVNVVKDIIDEFITVRLFTYDGKNVVPVVAVRNLILWRLINGKDVLLGEMQGYVADLGAPMGAVHMLFPETSYVYVAVWGGVPFPAANAFYTNKYVDSRSNAIEKIIPFNFSGGISMKEAIKKFNQ